MTYLTRQSHNTSWNFESRTGLAEFLAFDSVPKLSGGARLSLKSSRASSYSLCSLTLLSESDVAVRSSERPRPPPNPALCCSNSDSDETSE